MMISANKYNPSLPPEWRFNRVLEMVDRYDSAPGRCTQRDDVYVKGLRNFILRYRHSNDQRARDALLAEDPGLFWAFQIYERKLDNLDSRAMLIEARILAGQSDEDIAAELGTIPEVAEWYEALFFNVRDRLANHDWIVEEVLYPAMNRSLQASMAREAKPKDQRQTPLAQPFHDATLKLFAYFGGPFVLDQVIAGFRRGQRAGSADEVAGYFDGHYRNEIRHRSAMAATIFEVNQDNVMELFNVHGRLMEIEKSNDSLEHKQDVMHRAVSGFLKEMKFGVGNAGATLVAGTPVEPFDKCAAELRDGELLQLAAGGRPSTIDRIETLTMPPPHNKDETHAGRESDLH
jgi:hypothetical protein